MATNRPNSFRSSASPNTKPHISEKARQRPVRVLPADDRAEMEAGHLIGSGNPYSSNMARPDSDSREGYGPTGGFGGDAGSRESEAPDTDQGAVGGSFASFNESESADELS